MNLKKAVSLIVSLALVCCMAGCANDSSSDKASSDKSSSVSQNSSGSESSSTSEGSDDSSASDNSQDSSVADISKPDPGSDSSAANPKANAIGYDVKQSKRLYDDLKKTYGNGYKASMKSTASSGSELVIGVKGDKIYSSNKNQADYKSMFFTGGGKATVINNTAKSYTEQAVTDAKKFIAQNDLLFGQTGDFVSAQIDEKNDVIGEYYKLNTAVTGAAGQICYCFLGSTGELAQLFITYEGSEMPIYFRITELTSCDDELFKLPDLKTFKKN